MRRGGIAKLLLDHGAEVDIMDDVRIELRSKTYA